MSTIAGDFDPEMPIDFTTGNVYHLACAKADVADNFILVGDPGRVPMVASLFDKGSVRFSNQHREIALQTGTYKGVPITCLSTGMGPDNTEIVLNEIHVLKEYNVKSKKWDSELPGGKVNIIRVGTCGSPNVNAKVGDLAITQHVIGMDNTCRFYDIKTNATTQKLEDMVNNKDKGGVFHKTGGAYATVAHPDVSSAITKAAVSLPSKRRHLVGITATGSGFYGCQGRSVGRFIGHIKIPNLIEFLSSVRLPLDNGQSESVVNIEMESSALCALSELLGYRAGAVCLVVAKRAGDTVEFLPPEEMVQGMMDTITVGLDALVTLSS